MKKVGTRPPSTLGGGEW